MMAAKPMPRPSARARGGMTIDSSAWLAGPMIVADSQNTQPSATATASTGAIANAPSESPAMIAVTPPSVIARPGRSRSSRLAMELPMSRPAMANGWLSAAITPRSPAPTWKTSWKYSDCRNTIPRPGPTRNGSE